MDLESVPEILRAPLTRWWERASAAPKFLAAYAGLSERMRAELPRVAAGSEFAAAAMIQDPEILEWLGRHMEPAPSRGANADGGVNVCGVTSTDGGAQACMTSADGRAQVGVTSADGGAASTLSADGATAGMTSVDYESRAAAAPAVSEAQRLLREWRRREMLRIAWRDIASQAIAGQAALRETLHALSDLADGAIRAAAAAARLHLQPIFGVPCDLAGHEVPLIVLAMGKLGGRELNFSSDVDLIFLFSERGQTDGARSVENEEYFNRLGRELIRLLDARTEDGFVFRIDMRLRPFGDSGPLVVSLASLEAYLQEHGRDWERYAWIKARAVVGGEAYAAAYEEFVRPFVYRRYLDFGVIESLREMKALIAREVSRRELETHLKLGRGGIREIEFIVQSMQLVRGGSDRRLQNCSLLDVLPLLAALRLVSAADIAQLTDAYCVLRKAENAMQMVRDEQTHSLPAEAPDRARLSVILGVAGWDQVAARVTSARADVARQFDALLFGAPDGQNRQDETGAVWLASEDAKIDQELERDGFPQEAIAQVAAILAAYRQTAAYRRLDEAGRRRVHLIVDRLLRAAQRHRSPAGVVLRVMRVLEAIGTRSSYLALLKERPAALDRLIEVCAISGFLSRQIADFPLLLDELIDAKAFDAMPSRQGFAQELSARTERLPADDPERQVEALRQFQKVAVFAVALADLTGRLPLMKVSDRLTDIAELIVQCCVDLAWQQMTDVYGVPRCGESDASTREVRVAVAGYGKLGGLELGYGSDLDLVFLHDSSGEIQQTAGERPLDNGIFFLRLGQRIVHLLTIHSAAGRLYEVDMRLRPNGKGGFLMTGIEAFERYQREEAWTWEHQALLRARPVAGDAALCKKFEAARRRILCVAAHRDTLRADVSGMRARMRRELSKAGAGQFDIKQDAGGIADIEFLVQYWVLAAAHERPELLTYTDNIRQLEGLAAAGVLAPATAQWLTEAYIGYRTVLHHLSLEGEGERVVEAAPYAPSRARLSEIWRETFG